MKYKQSGQKNIKNVKTFTLTLAVGAGNALSPKTARRARILNRDVAKFTLDIRYFGPQDKPLYQLTLRVPIIKDRRSTFWPAAQLSQTAAKEVIDHLAADGFFDRAKDITLASVELPKGPAYTMFASGGGGCSCMSPSAGT
ncbi:MAG: hypothetical protein QGG25_18245 [Phycisphaerae bacterium]|jgi:hypothetical protein|nr:hypothetical protein [Phycisphaerae bacterium]